MFDSEAKQMLNVEPHIVENEQQDILTSSILRAGITYIASSKLLEKKLGKNSYLGTAVSIASSFLVNAISKNSNLETALISSGLVGGSAYLAPLFLKRSDSFYARMKTFNNMNSFVNGFFKKYKEVKMEAFQKYFKERGDETRLSTIRDIAKNSIGYMLGKEELKRSDAYGFLTNNKTIIEQIKGNTELTITDYRELEASLPSHLSDYARKYFKARKKIDDTSYDTSKLLPGVSYFTNKNKKIDDGYGDIDVLGVFRNKLAKDFNFIFEENSRLKELQKLNGFITKEEDTELLSLKTYIKKELIKELSGKSFSNPNDRVEYLKTVENPIVSAIMRKQANKNEYKYMDFSIKYNEIFNKHANAIKKTFEQEFNNPNVKKGDALLKTLEKHTKEIQEIKEIKNSINPYMITQKFRKDTSEIIEDIVNGKALNKTGSPVDFIYTFRGKSEASKLINNMRIHKFIEKNSKGELVDTSGASIKNIFLSGLSSIQSNLTPYFKMLPFGGSELKKFDTMSAFGIREKVVKNLDDSHIFAFKDSEYSVHHTLREVRSQLASIREVKKLYLNELEKDSTYTISKAIKKFNSKIYKDKQSNGTLVSDPSAEIYKNRYVPGKDNFKSIKDLNKLEDLYKEEYVKTSTDILLVKSGLRYGTMFSADESYHTFSATIKGVGKDLDIKINKKLQNPNTVLVTSDNKVYVREAKIDKLKTTWYTKADDNAEYTTNNFVKKVQSMLDLEKTYYTHDSATQGIYIDKNEMPNQFSLDEFKQSNKKIDYILNSDLNFLPFSKKKPFNDEANIFMFYKQRISDNMKISKKLKEKGEKSNFGLDDLFAVVSGNTFRRKGSELIEKEELDLIIDSFNKNKKYGLDELFQLMNSIKTNHSKNEYLNDLYQENFATIENLLKYKGSLEKANRLDVSVGGFKLLEHYKLTKIIMKHDNNKGLELMVSDDVLSKANTQIGINRAFVETNITMKKHNNIKRNDNFYSNDLNDLFKVDKKEVEYLYKSKFVENLFKNSRTYSEFENIIGKDLLDSNIFFNKDRLRFMNRKNELERAKATIVKKSFSNINIKEDGIKGTAKKIRRVFSDSSIINNKANILAMEMIESAENVFNVIGIPKLIPDNKRNTISYMKNFLGKRVFPMIGSIYALNTINAITDIALPDEVPLIGEGVGSGLVKTLAYSRMALQVLINTSGLGFVFRTLEEKYPGMFTGNGLFAPLDLEDTNQAMYDKLFNGEFVEVRKNRFWFSSGRQEFKGAEVKEFRPHLLYMGQHRDSGIYDSKIEKFFRKDFTPTSLLWYTLDAYKEEKMLAEKGIFMPKSEQLFTDIPIVGGVLNSTVGSLIKPTRYFKTEDWKIDEGVALNPNYDPHNPNTSPVVNYRDPNIIEKAVIPMYEDLTELFGMRGYMFKKGIKFMFTDLNYLQNETALDSLDRHYGLANSYEALQMGGMFGTTEGIRRIISENKIKQKAFNPIENETTPDWFPENYFKKFNYGKNTQFGYFADYYMPGEKYKETQGLHSDETYGEYGLLDRLRILSINAPYSNEYKMYKKEALAKILSNQSTEDETSHIYKSISYAEEIKNKNIYDDVNQIVNLQNKTISINKIDDINEITDDSGIRYKISNINANALTNYSKKQIGNDFSEYMNYLKSAGSLDVYFNSDAFSSVKSDEKGEYIEVFAPELEQFDKINQQSYLKSSYDGRSYINSMLGFVNNMYKPNYLEKLYNKKGPYQRWYEESIITPEFKDWETPFDRFATHTRDFSHELVAKKLAHREICV